MNIPEINSKCSQFGWSISDEEMKNQFAINLSDLNIRKIVLRNLYFELIQVFNKLKKFASSAIDHSDWHEKLISVWMISLQIKLFWLF